MGVIDLSRAREARMVMMAKTKKEHYARYTAILEAKQPMESLLSIWGTGRRKR